MAAMTAFFITIAGSRPDALMAAGVKRTPSVSRATGRRRKKLMMVMHENRLMLSKLPCNSSGTHKAWSPFKLEEDRAGEV